MSNKPLKAIAICGSLRKNSWNLKLLTLALKTLESNSVQTEFFDLSNIPIFNSGKNTSCEFPKNISTLRDKVSNSDLLIISSPEYNNSISGALKSAIEWLSLSPNTIDGKLAYIMGCSPGRSGAMRMHMQLSYILESEGVFLIPTPRILLPNIQTLISESGEVIQEELQELITEAMQKAIKISEKF